MDQTLWEGISIPPWDAEALYALFLRYRVDPSSLSASESDQFTRYLMHLISIRFANKRWMEMFPKAGIEPQNAAQSLLMHLLRKLQVMNLRHTGYRVFLSCAYQEVYFAAMTLLETSKRKDVVASAVTTGSEESGPMFSAHPGWAIDITDRLSSSFRAFESSNLDDIKGDAHALQALYRLIVRSLTRQNRLLAWPDLPERLQLRLDPAQHALVVSRVIRLLEDLVSESDAASV